MDREWHPLEVEFGGGHWIATFCGGSIRVARLLHGHFIERLNACSDLVRNTGIEPVIAGVVRYAATELAAALCNTSSSIDLS